MDKLHAMQVFVQVAEQGSFTAGAARMNLSTAQASRLVNELENHLHTRLLHRSTRRLALTSAGEKYLRHCLTILEQVEAAESEAGSRHQHPHGELKVHSLASFARHLLMPLVIRYKERYPEVTVHLSLSQRNPNPMDEGYDVVVALTNTLPDSNLVAHRLGTSGNLLCASPDYLRRYPRPHSPHDLRQHRCLQLVDPASPVDWRFEREGKVYTLTPAPLFTANMADIMAQACLAGMGLALLPDYTCAEALRSGSLIQLLPGYQLYRRNIYALFPSRRYLDARIRTWVDFLRTELPPQLENLPTSAQESRDSE